MIRIPKLKSLEAIFVWRHLDKVSAWMFGNHSQCASTFLSMVSFSAAIFLNRFTDSSTHSVSKEEINQ